jgi:hypothetical protein
MFSGLLNETQIEELVPFINKARKLDYINSDLLAERSQQATQSGFSQSVTIPMQLNYAKIELGEDTVEYKRVKAIFNLDPFATKTTDDKLAMSSSGTASKAMLILSDNINQFVIRAENEFPNFYDLTYKEQEDILMVYVKEIEGTTNTIQVQ